MTALKETRLMKVDFDENNNKFYRMRELSAEELAAQPEKMLKGIDLVGSYFLATWGRVGNKGQSKLYPMENWDLLKCSKERKDYKDNTRLMVVQDNTPKSEPEPLLNSVMTFLSEASQHQVEANYELAAYDDVTQPQIEEVQTLLGGFGRMISSQASMFSLNNQLKMICAVLPRKMGNLRELKLETYEQATARLEEEQDMVDALAAQTTVATSGAQSITEALGLTCTLGNDMLAKIFFDYPYIKDHEGQRRARVENFWHVVHEPTAKRYDAYRANDLRYQERLYFHGSRNQNWMSILNTGLLIRPPGVSTNGSMFGDGLYFADQPMKSLGYSDMADIGRWAVGNDQRGFLALFKVNVGRQYHLKNSGDHRKLKLYDEYELALSKLNPFKYDSVYVHQNYNIASGMKIHNNEFIVFRSEQATIAGLVEVKPV